MRRRLSRFLHVHMQALVQYNFLLREDNTLNDLLQLSFLHVRTSGFDWMRFNVGTSDRTPIDRWRT